MHIVATFLIYSVLYYLIKIVFRQLSIRHIMDYSLSLFGYKKISRFLFLSVRWFPVIGAEVALTVMQ